MGGSFIRWNHDRAQDVFDPWAALYSYSASAHAGHELKGDAEACVNASPIASVPVAETRFCNQPASHHLHGNSDLQERQRSTSPQYYDSASDSSLSTDSDSISSISGSSHRPSRHRTDFVELQLQNAELKKALQVQQKQVSELHTQLSSLRGELSTTTASYERLLSRVIPTPNNSIQLSSFQPFFRILKFARAANSKLPIYQREDYNGQFYWTEESFVKEHHNGFSGLTVIQDEHSGPVPFLVGENGVVVSVPRQDQLFRYGRILYNTLLRYEMAPRVWDDIDVYALEWFCLAMRIRCLEFRLCDDHWKAEAFASMNYDKWQQPHGATLSSSDSEMICAHQLQQTETEIPVSQSGLASQEPCRHKEIAVQVTNICLPDEPEPVVDNYATGAATHTPADDAISDTPPACNRVEVQDGDLDLPSYPILFSVGLSSPCNLFSTDPVEAHGEDPPDYSALKAAECARSEAIKAVHKEKRQQYEILKGNPIYKGKARGKEKKQHHVHGRRELDDFITLCMDDLEYEREQARRRTIMARQRMAKSRTSVRRRQADKQATINPSATEQEQQKERERRADVRRRLDGFAKYVDHVERAYRKEESSLLARQFSEESTSDRDNFLMRRKVELESEEGSLTTKKRLSRMLPDFKLYHGIVISQRLKEFRMKQVDAEKKIAKEKEERLKEKHERKAREAAQAEAAALQAKVREAREKMAAAQHQGRAPSILAQASTSRKSWKGIPEIVTTTPKYRPTVLEPRTMPTTQTVERGDSQAEARMKAQVEFQARMKARMEAQAAASANRQRELELAVALEDARRKAQRTETGEGPITSTHLTNTPRIRAGTASPAHRTSYIATSPGTLRPVLASEPVAQRHVSGWRSRTTAMAQGGGSMTPPTPPKLPHFADDSSGVFGGSAKLPQAQLTPVSSHVGPSTPVVRRTESIEEAVPTIPRADTSAKGSWRPRRLANLSTVTTKVVDDTREATPVVRPLKTHVTTTNLTTPYKTWRARETKG